MGPIFFQGTLNSQKYIEGIFNIFKKQLTEDELFYGIFQQDSAPAHATGTSLNAVHEVFTEEGTISRGLWPTRSPGLNACDYFLWEYLKSVVYKNNPHTLDQLKDNITLSIRERPP